MDIYQIDAMELWYSILYPIVFLYLPIIIIFLVITLNPNMFAESSIAPTGPSPWYELGYFGYIGIVLSILLLISLFNHRAELTSFATFIKFIENSFLLKIYLVGLISYLIYYIVTYLVSNQQNVATRYEPFENASDIAETLSQVQGVTQSLRSSLDTLATATDDTCSVIKGIEEKYMENATAPSGDGDPPSPAEAKNIKAKLLPAATKKWNQEKSDWAATHGKVPVVECFADGSLQELVEANRQLSDLLESAPVQRVVSQVKSLQTSNLFAQKYINDLAAKLTEESFENPSPGNTIATSNMLIAKTRKIQSTIQGILESSRTLKNNYVAMNAKANDPNTVNNLAGKKV
jgi:hypothetical protein